MGAKLNKTASGADDDIISRLGKVRAVFGKLTGVWKSNILSKRTKIRMIFKSNVIPVCCCMFGNHEGGPKLHRQLLPPASCPDVGTGRESKTGTPKET